MPGGKVPVRGGMAWGKLSLGVGIKSLASFRSKKAPLLSYKEARSAHKRIREAFKYYRMAHGGGEVKGRDDNLKSSRILTKEKTRPVTRTEITKTIKKIKKAAANVLKHNGDDKSLDSLDDALCQKTNLLGDLYSAMRRQDVDICHLRARLVRRTFSDANMRAVQALADIDVKDIVPDRKQPDPPLVRLAAELSPVWREVTGRSPYPTDDRYGNKKCPFAEWLGDQIKVTGFDLPPENRISLIVKKQRKLKK